MIRASIVVLALVQLARTAAAQVTTEMVRGNDGQMYQVTRQVVQRTVPVTEYQPRQEKVFRPQTRTQYTTQQTQQYVPITEYRWVSRERGWWNPFADTYTSYEWQAVTRWEVRPGTLYTPVTKTDWVEEQRTVQVPVTAYKQVQEEFTQRVAVAAPASAPPSTLPSAPAPATVLGAWQAGGAAPRVATLPASPYGGVRLDNDPPRSATSLDPSAARYR